MNALLKRYLKDFDLAIEDIRKKRDLEKMFEYCDANYEYFDVDEAFDICTEVIDRNCVPEDNIDEILAYRMRLLGRG